ncbi:MAG TPA: type II toxin-antitoxin system RelB/DinJ family antitoxin [Bacillota bacterium]|nr:type II toxin-antitoxin system RelB/DinJ family antitoxin [Bacillota bacterium]
MAITTIEVRVDTELLEEVKPILEAIGITVEESIRIFIEETVRLGQLPFPYTEEDIEEAK